MWKALLNRSLVGLLAIVGLFVGFYVALNQVRNSSVKQRFTDRQTLIARAQASNLTTFFDDFGNSVKVLAQSASIKGRDAATVAKMDAFVDVWGDSGLVGGVILTDAKGIVRFNSNISGTRDLDASVADRDYFVWAKTQETDGEYFVSEPVVSRLGATRDNMIVVVAAPVLKGDKFTGVIAASVQLKELTGRYMSLMNLSEETRVYFISGSGDLVYNASAGSPDMELLDEAKDLLDTPTAGSMEKKGHFVAYAPARAGNQEWLLVMVYPSSELTNLIQGISFRQLTMLVLGLLSLILVWLAAQKRL